MVENEQLIGAQLTHVSTIDDPIFTSPELCFDQVQFVFESLTLTLKAISDTDEIELIHSATIHHPDFTTPDWARSLIGKKLQTIWTCENAQGYQDQVIFAFGQFQPNLALLAEGSVLKVFQMRSLQKSTAQLALSDRYA